MSYCHKSSVTFYNSDYNITDFFKQETKLKIDSKLKKKEKEKERKGKEKKRIDF